jgi:flagellar motor switch protein FliN/FliY
MTLIAELAATNDIAMAVATALEQALGADVILAVGMPRQEAPTPELLPTGGVRGASAQFVDGETGSLTLLVDEAMARRLEATAADETLMSALGPALEQGAAAITATSSVRVGSATEIDGNDAFAGGDGEYLVYPLLDGAQRVAALVVRVGDDTSVTGTLPSPATPVAAHDFQPLTEGAMGTIDIRPLQLLNEVEMGVTAELGRRRMTVRELLSLTPGTVIELDRAAGSPVDVLVNGTLIARGEVVVIDEEFGIRISEIVVAEPAAR